MALKAVFFDVGETLVDEERWWRELAERAGLQPHVVRAALGVTMSATRSTTPCGVSSGSSAPTARCPADEVAYVGDCVDNDVLPAAGAGLVAVHVRRGQRGRLQPTSPEAALGIDDLAALAEALASLP